MPRLREPKDRPRPQILTSEPELFEASEPEAIEDGDVTEKVVDNSAPVVDRQGTTEAEAAADLKKQIEALRRGEEEQRRRADKAEAERQQARQDALDRTTEAERARTEVVQSRATLFDTGIAKETDAVDAAKRDLTAAHASGDTEAVINAYERLAEAKARLETLRNGKAAIDSEIEEAKKKPEPKPQAQRQPTLEEVIDSWNVPNNAKQWLKEHSDYVTDPRKNSKIQSLHWDVLDEGHQAFSPGYYKSLETHLGLRKGVEKVVDDDEPEERSSIVSAPVSRDIPSSNGTRQSGVVKLTPAQREAAKVAGITETEYAKQYARLLEEKANGNYRDQR